MATGDAGQLLRSLSTCKPPPACSPDFGRIPLVARYLHSITKVDCTPYGARIGYLTAQSVAPLSVPFFDFVDLHSGWSARRDYRRLYGEAPVPDTPYRPMAWCAVCGTQRHREDTGASIPSLSALGANDETGTPVLDLCGGRGLPAGRHETAGATLSLASAMPLLNNN